MFFSLFIFLIFFPLSVFASTECSSVDLTAGTEASMAAIPRWNQGDSNLCYSYVAATMIDEYRYSRGDKDRTHTSSPFLLALKTIERFEQDGSSLKGGKIEHAFSAAKMFGTCSSLNLSDHLGKADTKNILQKFTEVHSLAQKSAANKKQAITELFKFFQESGAKPEDWPSSLEVERNLGLSLTQFLNRTLMPFCGESKDLSTLPNLNIYFRPEFTGEEVLQQTQNLLNSNIPVGINFCANVTTDPFHKGRMQNGKWLCDKNKNHSALIAGRKVVAGKCQFLIRDTGCEGYEKSSPGRCNQGQYWLDAESLTQNLHGIFWLD